MQQDLIHTKQFLKNILGEVRKEGFYFLWIIILVDNVPLGCYLPLMLWLVFVFFTFIQIAHDHAVVCTANVIGVCFKFASQ